MRLFVAVTIPDKVKSNVAGVQQGLIQESSRVDADIKWVDAEQFHLTLKFLGECSPAKTKKISAALETAVMDVPPFSVTLGGISGFPSKGPLMNIWTGLLMGEARLKDLAGQVALSLESLRFKNDGRPFNAHLTLGRPRQTKNIDKIRTWIEQQPKEPLGTIQVKSFALIESVLSPAGPAYKELQRFKLQDNPHPLPPLPVGEGE